MTTNKIIVISAHPDDYELGMAMRIRKYADEGADVTAVIATKGEYPDSPEGRAEESEKSAQILGIKEIIQLGLPCARLPEQVTPLRLKLEEIIKKIKPIAGYTIYPQDIHVDHQVVSQQSLTAFRLVPNVYYFKVAHSAHFEPNTFFFGDKKLFQVKTEALKCYQSEVEKGGTIDLNRLTQLSKYEYHNYLHHRCIWSVSEQSEINKKNLYFEPFVVERIIQY